MASATPLQDIDEQFLQCCICMEQLREPKVLPCLHRYCRDCLKKVFKEAKEIECPTCREKHTLPEGGIDSLRTDFNTKNIIEFIQLQSSVKVDPLRRCIHCRKRLEASAFCFKCNDFLCHSCHEFHVSSEMVKDHHPHIFSLSEAEARNLTIKRLSSLKEAPRCATHPRKLSEICCTTCGNLPICMPCTYGAHTGHNLKEVTSLAKIERYNLMGRVADLMQYKEKIYKMQEEIKKTKEDLDQTVDEKKRKLKEQRDAEEENIRRDIRDIDEKLKKTKAELEEKMKKKASRRKQELEEEMREVREKYERVCKEERQETDAEFNKLQQENEREKKRLQKGLDATNSNINELLASLKTQEEEKRKKIKEQSDHFDDIVRKFETVTTAVSSILAAEHDWTDVQCIPDICRAIDPLLEEVKRAPPELGSLSDIIIKGLSPAAGGKMKVDISEKEESIIHMRCIGKDWITCGITGNHDGSIIVTGMVPDNYSHITVINRTGEEQRRDLFHKNEAFDPRYCDVISKSKVASVCRNNEISIYDITDGTYRKITLSNAVKSWPTNQRVSCVTVDHSNNTIIVGCESGKYLYVFNDQLRHIHTLEVPEIIKNIYNLSLHEGNLLICDSHNWMAYAVSMKQTGCELLYKFTKPGVGGQNWLPVSVCTDRNGFVYVLWENSSSGKHKSLVVQYGHDGGQLLTTRLLDEKYYAVCMTTLNTEDGEKLALATFRTGQLITYGLG